MVMADSAGGHTDASKSKPSNAEVRSNWQAERAGREAEARGWKPTGPRRGERLGSRQPSQRARTDNSLSIPACAITSL